MLPRVESWLKEIGLGAYSQVFVDNHITEDLLFSITEADLEKMKFSVGHRLTFFRALQRLQETVAEVGIEPTECSTQAELQGERRLLSILFCDVVDSTRLSQLLDAEEVIDVMAEFYRSCDAIAQRMNGTLVATQGDGVLCCFGWPLAHEDDALRAIHAGLEMIVQIPKYKVPLVPDWNLDVRVGIATGTVILDKSNRYGRLQIAGVTTNLAERLKGACPSAAVVIDSLTKKLVGAHFELEELGQHSLKGFGEPIPVCKVIAPRYGLTRFEGMHPSRPAPLIGRQSELDLLMSRWQVVKLGESQTILLTGPAGIGKSRLAASITESVAEDQCHVQVYQCSSTNQNTALYCLINRIMRDAKIKQSDEIEIRRAKLEIFLDKALPPAQESFGIFASLLSIPAHAGDMANEMMPEQWKAAAFDAIIAELVHLAKSKPVIVLFEDIHWIDPTSLDLLNTILRRCKQLPSSS